ncbi:MFS transporter [Neiella marina]|uniref:MFS transporter n=1 Tax=Neiella marina TaxID=508461 RepID=A0A8J2U3Q7_9GAMM|nr:MFS transporter [Neiella marina]GGA71082.1 MFS transporter [Neiella marina]
MFRIARTPQHLLLCMMFLMSFGFATWMVLLNNFVVERAQFTGVEIGILQSVREIPGFLAFTAIFILLLIREQSFALLSLAIMFIGILLTGFFPSAMGLYITTVIMSIGFHYFETINKSLTLQWLDKKDTAEFMGQALSIKAIASLSAYGLIWLIMGQLGVDYVWVYALVGGLGIIATIAVVVYFKNFAQHASQHKKLIFRQRYWLYYALVFLSGARRQIFVVFAGFMMVEKFGYSVSQISTLFIANYVFNFLFAKKIGAFIGRVGERRALVIEYVGLILVFGGYAVVDNANMAAALYIIDHLFFAFAIAINTYFQKIADPRDIASSASVSFTINHIAAVVIPALLGVVWIYSQAAVFLIGAGFAVASLLLASCIPAKPEAGNEVVWARG